MDVSLQADVLELTLLVTEDSRTRQYKSFLVDDSLPAEVKKELKTVGNLFAVLERKKNFKVDTMKGQIILLLRRLEVKEVEIKLKLVKEEEEKEGSMTSRISEFGGEIEDLEFP